MVYLHLPLVFGLFIMNNYYPLLSLVSFLLKKLFKIIVAFALFSFIINAYAKHVADSTSLLQAPVLTPEKSLTLSIERLDDLNNFELRQTDGSILLFPYVDGFEVADFNFDGYDDLRVYRIEGRNTLDELFIYMPTEKKYILLVLPEKVRSLMLCDGFKNTQILENKKTLLISCNNGHIQNINLNYLQFHSTGQIWLTQQYRYEPLEIPQALLAYTDLPWGITHQLTIYDASQTPMQTLRTSQALEPIVFKVLTALSLQETTENESAVILNLKPQQICNLISVQDEWLEISCSDPEGNQQTGWINWQTMTQQSTSHKPFMITESSSAKLY